MIPYTGKNNSKQTVRNKTNKSGYRHFQFLLMMGIHTSLIHIVQNKYVRKKESKNLRVYLALVCVTEITN